MKNTYSKTEARQSAKNLDVVLDIEAAVRWRLADAAHQSQRWWMALLAVALIALYYATSRPMTSSPFVRALHDLFDPDSDWLLEQFGGQLGWSFWSAVVFMVLLVYVLYQLHSAFPGSKLRRASELDVATGREMPVFYRHIFLVPVRFSRRSLLFWVTLVSNLALYWFCAQRIQQGTAFELGRVFSIVYVVALISRILALFYGVATLLNFFLHDYGRRIRLFIKAYARYFYPPVLSILIVLYVFSRMDQFDGLFIELVQDWFNLALFTFILLPGTVVIVWFAPNYLWFTDYSYANRVKIWYSIVAIANTQPKNTRQFNRRLNGLIYKHKRLIPEHDGPLDEALIPPKFSRYRRANPGFPSEAFHRTRSFIGVLFYLVVLQLCLSIFFDNSNWAAYWKPIIFLIVCLASLIYWGWTYRVLRKSMVPVNVRYRPLSSAPERKRSYQLLDDYTNCNEVDKVYLVRNQLSYYIGLVAAVLSIILLVVVLAGWDGARYARTHWYVPFAIFCVALSLVPIGFAWLAIYRRFYKRHTFNRELATNKQEARLLAAGKYGNQFSTQWTDRKMDRHDSWSVQIMLWYTVLIGLLFLLILFGGLFFGGQLLSSSFIAKLNPLNIFLIFLNGFIALIMLVDRYLLINDHSRQFRFFNIPGNHKAAYNRTGTANALWGALAVLALLLSVYYGNSYHQVDYHAGPNRGAATHAGQAMPAEASRPIPFETYAERFWRRYQAAGNDKPILVVAADGGGLKACYWTMRNLYTLDTMGLLDDNLFLTSGASGGNMGLAMYTYLKARGVDTSIIRQRIDELGDRNYLSGDIMGLLTRFPLSYLPNHFGPNKLEDRAEAMARAYFRILDQGLEGAAYDSLRTQPYYQLWADRGYDFPVFIANTSRAEDGMRGIVHPFAPNEDMAAGTIDLSRVQLRGEQPEYISYPDAAFLANRFPVVSPAARIKGHGHFLDAGQADNSGLATAYQMINYLKSVSLRDSTSLLQSDAFRTNFFDRLVLMSVRNAPSRYTRDALNGSTQQLGRIYPRSEVAANLSTAVNTGLTGVPRSWDDYLRSSTPRDLGMIDTFMAINLPFRLDAAAAQLALGGELRDPRLQQRIDSLNCRLFAAYGCTTVEACRAGDDNGYQYPALEKACFTVEPPLGRLLAEPTRLFMDRMLEHVDVQGVRAVLQE